VTRETGVNSPSPWPEKSAPFEERPSTVGRSALKLGLLVFLCSLVLRGPWASFAHATPISDFETYDALGSLGERRPRIRELRRRCRDGAALLEQEDLPIQTKRDALCEPVARIDARTPIVPRRSRCATAVSCIAGGVGQGIICGPAACVDQQGEPRCRTGF
jgi:hypothetical protein